MLKKCDKLFVILDKVIIMYLLCTSSPIKFVIFYSVDRSTAKAFNTYAGFGRRL